MESGQYTITLRYAEHLEKQGWLPLEAVQIALDYEQEANLAEQQERDCS